MDSKLHRGQYYLGYDIGGTKCSIVLGDKDFKVHEKIIFATETQRGHQEIINEFKDFAVKGNVIDLAVAVIIGGAFGKIVTSFVGDMVMPLIAWFWIA